MLWCLRNLYFVITSKCRLEGIYISETIILGFIFIWWNNSHMKTSIMPNDFYITACLISKKAFWYIFTKCINISQLRLVCLIPMLHYTRKSHFFLDIYYRQQRTYNSVCPCMTINCEITSCKLQHIVYILNFYSLANV